MEIGFEGQSGDEYVDSEEAEEEIEEVAVGDYSPEYGHVKTVEVSADEQIITLTFINGTTTTQPRDFEMEFDQGGRF